MKKGLISFVICALILLQFLPATANALDVIDQGTINSSEGWSLTWVLSSSGTLTISGEAPIADYSYYGNTSPWYGHRYDIKSVIIEDGITRIGKCAFCNCNILMSVSVAGSVTEIDEDAFSNCGNGMRFLFKGNAPEISYKVGELKNAIAYYPADDATWSQYSWGSGSWHPKNGTMTWEAYEIHNAVQATCENKGYTGDYVLKNGAVIESGSDIDAIGHDWDVPTYEWSTDNSTVTATRVCKHDSNHKEYETVNSTWQITKNATCEEKGETTYTSAKFTNGAFVVQEKTVANIPATNHDWNETIYNWGEDNSTVTAIRVCKNDPSHIQEETVNTSSVISVAATHTADGEKLFTSAAFTNPAFEIQTKTVIIPATGVTITGATGCTAVGLAVLYQNEEFIQSVPIKDGVFTMKGVKVGSYTLKLSQNGCYEEDIPFEVKVGQENYPPFIVQMMLIGDINGVEK